MNLGIITLARHLLFNIFLIYFTNVQNMVTNIGFGNVNRNANFSCLCINGTVVCVVDRIVREISESIVETADTL